MLVIKAAVVFEKPRMHNVRRRDRLLNPMIKGYAEPRRSRGAAAPSLATGLSLAAGVVGRPVNEH